MKLSLRELADWLGVELENGKSEHMIFGVATLANADTARLSFFANSSYLQILRKSRAGCVLISRRDAEQFSGARLISNNPYADFARVAALFEAQSTPDVSIHRSAIVAPGAQIEANVSIGPNCVIESTARIENGARIGAGCFIGPECQVGADSELMPRVTLVKRVRLGRSVRVHSGAVLGADGFGFAPDARLQTNSDPRLWVRVPQLGGVVVGDHCDIGANTTIDCGALDDTILGRNVLLDNQIQIAHNVKIGNYTAIAGCTAIAGSAEIGSHCLIGGAVGIAGHLQICDGVTVLAMSFVGASIMEKGVYGGSMPLMPQREWRKNAVHIRRLDDSLRSLQASARKDHTPDDFHSSN